MREKLCDDFLEKKRDIRKSAIWWKYRSGFCIIEKEGISLVYLGGLGGISDTFPVTGIINITVLWIVQWRF